MPNIDKNLSISSQEIHNRLMKLDADYASDWKAIYQSRSSGIFEIWDVLDLGVADNMDHLTKLGISSSDKLRRHFVRVAERQLRPTAIRSDLSMLARSKKTLEEKYEYGLQQVSSIREHSHHKGVALYGNIKKSRNIVLDAAGISRKKRTDLVNVDYRDLVRFRMVCTSISEVVYLSVRTWETLFNQIILCKNFYLNPLSKVTLRPYRGVHFLFVDASGFPFELQIVTANREAVGVLDHSSVYKSSAQRIDKDEISHIMRVSIFCNCLDSRFL